MTDASPPVSLRLAQAFAGRGLDVEPAPPLAWTGDGSVAVTAARRVAAAVANATRPLESVANRLAARPLRVAAAAVVVAPLSQSAGAPGVGIAAFAIAGLSVVLAAANRLHDGDERSLVLRVLVGGAILRLVFGAMITVQGGFPDETGTYHPIAADAATCWRVGGPATMAANVIVEGRAAYFHLLAGVYFLLGPVLAAGRVVGGLLGLAAALAAGEVGRAMGGRRAAALGVAVLALHPEHAFWSVTLSRDTLTTLLVLLTFAIVFRRPGRLLAGNLLVAAVPVAILAMNSFVVAGVLSAVLAAMALAESVVSARGAGRVAAVAAATLLAAAALVFVGNRYGGWFTPEMFTAIRAKAVGTAADFWPSLEFGNWWAVAAFVPAGAAFVLGAPWPWDAVNANRAAYGVLALVGIAIAAAGVAGLAAAARRRAGAAAPVILFALVLLVLSAVLEGNSGIVVRHRLPLTACLAVGAGVLFAGLRRDR